MNTNCFKLDYSCIWILTDNVVKMWWKCNKYISCYTIRTECSYLRILWHVMYFLAKRISISWLIYGFANIRQCVMIRNSHYSCQLQPFMTIHPVEAFDSFIITILNKRMWNILQNIIDNKKSTVNHGSNVFGILRHLPKI